ncbi:hypothetical protein ELH91_18425 [Rhizobium leguminosarum]|uniref:hypothetical protein n=1 Tax=Rhizobium leguminosarum TaxID=384 RepID=UPI0010300D4D|nr:hypothetical protein [Rhizobium leguminosarum]TAY18622.1 hypothetical protein ELH91_18425 [Rhizobium leguminosarum]
MSDWVPAISSSGVLALICFIWGTYYKATIEKGVQHRLDTKLEEMRSQFRQDEERHKQALKVQDERISALRSGALAGLASRSAALDKRRLEAIETLWAAASDYGPLKMAGKMTQVLNMEKLIEAAEFDKPGSENIRQFASFIWTTCKLDDYKTTSQNIARERPFVSPLAWAIYTAHAIAVSSPVVDLGAIRTGVGPKLLKDPKPLLDSIKAVLPDYTQYIDDRGSAAMPNLVEPLEEALLKELRKSLDGGESDEQTLSKAAAIIKAADTLSTGESLAVTP